MSEKHETQWPRLLVIDKKEGEGETFCCWSVEPRNMGTFSRQVEARARARNLMSDLARVQRLVTATVAGTPTVGMLALRLLSSTSNCLVDNNELTNG